MGHYGSASAVRRFPPTDLKCMVFHTPRIQAYDHVVFPDQIVLFSLLGPRRTVIRRGMHFSMVTQGVCQVVGTPAGSLSQPTRTPSQRLAIGVLWFPTCRMPSDIGCLCRICSSRSFHMTSSKMEASPTELERPEPGMFSWPNHLRIVVAPLTSNSDLSWGFLYAHRHCSVMR